jgi:hypothetical protein
MTLNTYEPPIRGFQPDTPNLELVENRESGNRGAGRESNPRALTGRYHALSQRPWAGPRPSCFIRVRLTTQEESLQG